VADFVFTQMERMETIDGGKYKAAMQAKRCLDTRAVVFTYPGAGGEWVVGTGVLSRAWITNEGTVRGVLSSCS
jgi:hypothetical protein